MTPRGVPREDMKLTVKDLKLLALALQQAANMADDDRETEDFERLRMRVALELRAHRRRK